MDSRELSQVKLALQETTQRLVKLARIEEEFMEELPPRLLHSAHRDHYEMLVTAIGLVEMTQDFIFKDFGRE